MTVTTGSIFKEIHRLRKHAKDVSTRIEQAPRQLKIQETLLAKKEADVAQALDAIKHLKVNIHEKEVSIKAVLTNVKKHEKQYSEAKDKKEFDALKNEIKQEKEQVAQLENEI